MNKDLEKSLDVLKNGGVILYPTDTIWGLGCDATNQAAVSKIYTIKKRVASKSMIVLVKDIEMLQNYVKKVPDKAVELIEATSNPLTIIYPDAKNLAKNIIAEDGSIAIRIPNEKFCQALLDVFGKPIVSTSANISGEVAPANYAEISDYIIEQADYVVSYRQNDFSKAAPSTIVKIQDDTLIYLRK